MSIDPRQGTAVGVPSLPADVTACAGRRGRSRLSAAAALLTEAAGGPAPDRAEAALQALAALIGCAETSSLSPPAGPPTAVSPQTAGTGNRP